MRMGLGLGCSSFCLCSLYRSLHALQQPAGAVFSGAACVGCCAASGRRAAASDVEAAPELALLAGALRVETPSPLLLVDGPFFAPLLQEAREANTHTLEQAD